MIIVLSTFIIALCGLFYQHWQKQITIKRWYRALDIDKHLTNYQRLFQNIDGFALSHQARITGDAIEYTYGEIDFVSFIALLSLVQPNTNTVFYDLGSGTGKAVLACAMVFNVKKSCGIELFNELHQSALKQQYHLQKLSNYPMHADTVHFINANFFYENFNDATLIFMNATAFFGEVWTTAQNCLQQLKSGTLVITTSKKLSLDIFRLIKSTRVQMSWGPVQAYIQQRI